MAERRDYYFRQKVTEAELDAGFEGLEQGDFNQSIDADLVGVMDGLGVAEKAGTPDLTVDIASGIAYSKQGERIRVATLQNQDVSVDDGSVSTAVGSGGNEKIVSVFVLFDRTLTDPRIDGNAVTVFFVRAESFQFSVVQGAEAGAGNAIPPAVDPNKILLVDITRTFSQTQIFDGDMDFIRKEWAIKLTGGTIEINTGTPEQGIGAVLTALNNHVDGAANIHPTSAIDGAADTVGDASVTAVTLDNQINEILAEINDRVLRSGDTITGALQVDEDVDAKKSIDLGLDLLGSEADGLIPRIRAGGVATGTGERILFSETTNPTANRPPIRIYMRHGTIVDYGVETTVNARWTGSLWSQDDAAVVSSIVRNNMGELEHQHKNSGAGTWADSSWDTEVFRAQRSAGDASDLSAQDARLNFKNVTVISNPLHTTAVLKNSLYASTMVKAWGNIEMSAAGAITASEGFNFPVPSNPGTSSALAITFATAMADGEYVVVAMPLTGGDHMFVATSETSAGFTIQKRAISSGALLNFDAGGAIDIAFLVIGKQT